MVRGIPTNSTNYEEVKCVNCRKLYPRRLKSSSRRVPIGTRGINTKTCCKNCSRAWNSLEIEERNRIKKELGIK